MGTDLTAAGTRPSSARDRDPWRGLLDVGAWSALANVGLIAVQVVVFLRWPPPSTTAAFFDLLVAHPIRGLVALDLLFVVSNVLVCLLYLALGVTLWDTSRSAVTVALALGLLGLASFLASPRPVEMLTLAHAYSDAAPAEQPALRAVGDGMLATSSGTAFDIYYLLNAVALLILTITMLRSSAFSTATAVWGIAAAALMVVPSTAGTVGLALSLASLVPWAGFSVLAALHLRRGAPARHQEPRYCCRRRRDRRSSRTIRSSALPEDCSR